MNERLDVAIQIAEKLRTASTEPRSLRGRAALGHGSVDGRGVVCGCVPVLGSALRS